MLTHAPGGILPAMKRRVLLAVLALLAISLPGCRDLGEAVGSFFAPDEDEFKAGGRYASGNPWGPLRDRPQCER